MSHVLTVLCALPLIAAFIVVITPRSSVSFIRGFTGFSMSASFAWSLNL